MKYIVFLDIDGVFTSARVHIAIGQPNEIWSQFDSIAIGFMNKLHDAIDDLRFVLISTWKEDLRNDDHTIEHWVTSSFRNVGFRGKFGFPWKTNPDNIYGKFPNRAFEIKDYLEIYAPENKDYIIFDDNNYGFSNVLGKNRFIQTDPDNGILLKHMKNALSIIGTWDKK